jgi:hypothetical protein
MKREEIQIQPQELVKENCLTSYCHNRMPKEEMK